MTEGWLCKEVRDVLCAFMRFMSLLNPSNLKNGSKDLLLTVPDKLFVRLVSPHHKVSKEET